MPYKQPDPNHFFEGRNLEADEKAFHKAINLQHDVEYSTRELMAIVEAFQSFQVKTEEEAKTKEAMITKTKEYMTEILYKKRNKGKATLKKLDSMD